MNDSSQAISQLTQASYARSFRELKKELQQQQEENQKELITTLSDQKHSLERLGKLNKQKKTLEKATSENNKKLKRILENQELLKQQQEILDDYQALAENIFTKQTARFFSASEKNFSKKHGVNKKELQRAIKNKTGEGVFTLNNKSFCCLQTPQGQFIFHPEEINPEKLFPSRKNEE